MLILILTIEWLAVGRSQKLMELTITIKLVIMLRLSINNIETIYCYNKL